MKYLLFLLLSTGLYAKLNEYCVNVNLHSDRGGRSLDVCLLIDTPKKKHEVIHNMIIIFSSKSAEEVSSTKGKEKVLKQVQEQYHISTKKIYISKFKISK